jgi:hypothetical protein
MGLSFQFSPIWWILFLVIYIPYLFFFLIRKSYKKPNELKTQLSVGIAGLLLALFIELIAVSNNLWSYTPLNWPIILWPCYFGSGLLGYQLTKSFEEFLGR